MTFIDRVRAETARSLNIEPSDVDWITDEYLESVVFDSTEGDSEFIDEARVASMSEADVRNAIVCTNQRISVVSYGQLRPTGYRCGGSMVYGIPEDLPGVYWGYNVARLGARIYFTKVNMA